MFFSIRQWKKDRTEFFYPAYRQNRGAVEDKILRRAERWGKAAEITQSDYKPLILRYRHPVSMTVSYSTISEYLAVYSVGQLSESVYRELMTDAGRQLRSVPAPKTLFWQTKQEKAAPALRVMTVIILADEIDEKVRTLVRKGYKISGLDCVMPCAAECSTGKYYLDPKKEYYQAGISERPGKNYAVPIAKRILFGYRLPKENIGTRPESDWDFSPEQSLWSFIALMHKEFKENKTGADRETLKMLEKLENGELTVGEYSIYYKKGNRLAVCSFIEDEEEPELLHIALDDKWELPRKNKRFALRRKIKPAEIKMLQSEIKNILTAQGYKVNIESEYEK